MEMNLETTPNRRTKKADLVKRLMLLISVLKKDNKIHGQLTRLEEDVADWADDLTIQWLTRGRKK